MLSILYIWHTLQSLMLAFIPAACWSHLLLSSMLATCRCLQHMLTDDLWQMSAYVMIVISHRLQGPLLHHIDTSNPMAETVFLHLITLIYITTTLNVF